MIRTVALSVFLAPKSTHGADSWRSKIRVCRWHSGVELRHSCLESCRLGWIYGNIVDVVKLWHQLLQHFKFVRRCVIADSRKGKLLEYTGGGWLRDSCVLARIVEKNTGYHQFPQIFTWIFRLSYPISGNDYRRIV